MTLGYFFGMILAPLVMLALVGFIARPASLWLRSRMKSGLLKRILFFSWKT